MALDPVVNFFRSTIATLPVASGGTSIVITTGDGAKLPDPAVDGNFNLTIYNEDDPFDAPEIVRVTAIAGDTLTVTRAQEGTSATNKTSGNTWYLELTPTAKTIQDIDTAKLDVAGGTMTGDLTIPDKIIHSGDTNTSIRFPADDTVAIETDGTEKIRATSTAVVVNETGANFDFRVEGDTNANLLFVDASADRVGIGTSTPVSMLHISDSSVADISLFISQNSQRYMRLRMLDDASQIGVDNGDTLGFGHYQELSNDSFTTRIHITSAGNVGIGTTTPATKLDVNGSIRTSTGILFGADTAAANTLDDYEEGTFTPTVIGLTTAGTGTYSVQLGRYIKIGKLVTAFVRLTWSAHNGTGNLAFDGLPFTVLNTANYLSSASIGIIGDISMTANNIPIAFARANTTRVELFQTPTGGGSALNVPIDTSATINFTVTYETA